MAKYYELDWQEKYVWLATENGWVKAAGFTAKVMGIGISIIPLRSKETGIKLVLSSLTSGQRIKAYEVDILDLLMCNTKGKTMSLYEQYLKELVLVVKRVGKGKIIEKDAAAEKSYAQKFGHRPDIEIIEDWRKQLAK